MTCCASGNALDEEEHARQHVDACGDHRRGVDERGDRRRALHGIRQPDVERNLRGLADRAAEDAAAPATVRKHWDSDCSRGHLRCDLRKDDVNRSQLQTMRMPSMKPKSPMRLVMNALFAAVGRGIAREPVADEQIAELTPTSSQKMNIIAKLFASTMPSIENMKSERLPK